MKYTTKIVATPQLLIGLFLLFLGASGSYFYFSKTSVSVTGPVILPPSDEISLIEPTVKVPFTATFKIYTHEVERSFSQAMYHNLSEDAYITNTTPHLVTVTKHGISWQEFFDTLPFSIDQTCLITGTKQTFCSDESNELSFYLNGKQNPVALKAIISPHDILVIKFEKK